MADVFRVLTVCTGNICRSAQIEQFIRSRVSRDFPELTSVIEVESAGTGAVVGWGMPAEAAALSAQYGGQPTEHSARQLVVDHVRAADLVLVAAAEHRSAVVRLLPRASTVTFMLTEFAALLESAEQKATAQAGGFSQMGGFAKLGDFADMTSAEKLRQGVKLASARRGYLDPQDSQVVDIVDPYKRSDEVYQESARQIMDALDRSQQAAVRLAERFRG